MTRIAFILAATLILVLTYGLGWFSHFLVHRIARVQGGDVDEIDRLAQDLHLAEEQRDEAMDAAEAQEAEMASRQAQTEAELKATMEGLRDARAEAEEMRRYIETLGAKA